MSAFGVAEATLSGCSGTVNIPNQFIQLIPYVLTIVVLAGFIRREFLPGRSAAYVKEW
jgi:ABC-type uncharacterized transport system permease subunit